MTKARERAKWLRTWARGEAESLEVRAVIVAVEQDHPSGSGSVTTFRVVGETNKVWVRLHGGEDNDIYEAYNFAVKARDGMRVIIKQTEGEYEVIRQLPKSGTDLYGEQGPALSGSNQIGELSETTWPARNLGPGRVAVAAEDTPLVVRIAPHWYVWHGQVRLWPGGTLDIEPYLPTTDTYWCWAWVCIDPSTDTPLAVTGEEVESLSLLTDSTLAAIGLTLSGLHPVDAIKLQEDMTELHKDYFVDGRVWLSSAQLPTVPIEVTTPYEIIPTGRQILWPAPLEITTGTLTIDGRIVL